MMVLLAIDATQSPINIAVGWDGAVHGHAIGPVQRNAADNLFEIIDEAINQSGKSKNDVGGVMAVTGPGSFTGIRVGLSFAQSFAFAKAIPVYGLTAFEILIAANLINAGKQLIIIESKRAELYAQFYQNSLPIGEPLMAHGAELTALAVLENAEILAPMTYQEVFGKLPNSKFYDPAQLATLALHAFWQIHPAAKNILEPFYIRPPDAIPQIRKNISG